MGGKAVKQSTGGSASIEMSPAARRRYAKRKKAEDRAFQRRYEALCGPVESGQSRKIARTASASAGSQSSGSSGST